MYAALPPFSSSTFPVRLGKILFGPAGGWLWVSCCVSWNPIQLDVIHRVIKASCCHGRVSPLLDGWVSWLDKIDISRTLYDLIRVKSPQMSMCFGENPHKSSSLRLDFFLKMILERIGADAPTWSIMIYFRIGVKCFIDFLKYILL